MMMIKRHVATSALALLVSLTLSTAALAQEADPASDSDPAPAVDPAADSGEGADAAATDTAEEPASTDEFSYRRGGLAGLGLSLGVKVGGGFGQLTSEFGASVVGEFELGYNFPVLDRALGLIVSLSYAGPTTEGQGTEDARLPGVMSYEVTQHQLILTAGLIGRIPVGLPMFVPYVAAGWRAYFMKSVINGEAGGQAFGENTETSASYAGAFGALGGELHLGDAGALALELQFGWSAIDQYVLRDTNVGSLNVALAYRIFL